LFILYKNRFCILTLIYIQKNGDFNLLTLSSLGVPFGRAIRYIFFDLLGSKKDAASIPNAILKQKFLR